MEEDDKSMKKSIKSRILCFGVAFSLLFAQASVESYAANSTTSKSNTATSSSTSTTTKSSTTTSGSTSKTTTTTTTTTTTKNKVGTKTWKTQKIVKEFKRNGNKIYGEIYRPVGDGKFPGIVICHGFNSNCGYAREFAQYLATKGVVAYIFDFIGGGTNVKSGGNTTDMSVLTEAQDFNVVFNGIRSLSYVDETRMFVMGESQGGYVATYIAGTRPKDIKGLIALYPAYNLGGDYTWMLQWGLIPEKMNFLGMTVGRKYFEDLSKVDIYKTMANFTGKTVIIHGTADYLVPISGSEQAVKTMKNAKLVKVQGGEHGFGVNSTVRTEAYNLIKELSNK